MGPTSPMAGAGYPTNHHQLYTQQHHNHYNNSSGFIQTHAYHGAGDVADPTPRTQYANTAVDSMLDTITSTAATTGLSSTLDGRKKDKPVIPKLMLKSSSSSHLLQGLPGTTATGEQHAAPRIQHPQDWNPHHIDTQRALKQRKRQQNQRITRILTMQQELEAAEERQRSEHGGGGATEETVDRMVTMLKRATAVDESLTPAQIANELVQLQHARVLAQQAKEIRKVEKQRMERQKIEEVQRYQQMQQEKERWESEKLYQQKQIEILKSEKLLEQLLRKQEKLEQKLQEDLLQQQARFRVDAFRKGDFEAAKHSIEGAGRARRNSIASISSLLPGSDSDTTPTHSSQQQRRGGAGSSFHMTSPTNGKSAVRDAIRQNAQQLQKVRERVEKARRGEIDVNKPQKMYTHGRNSTIFQFKDVDSLTNSNGENMEWTNSNVDNASLAGTIKKVQHGDLAPLPYSPAMQTQQRTLQASASVSQLRQPSVRYNGPSQGVTTTGAAKPSIHLQSMPVRSVSLAQLPTASQAIAAQAPQQQQPQQAVADTITPPPQTRELQPLLITPHQPTTAQHANSHSRRNSRVNSRAGSKASSPVATRQSYERVFSQAVAAVSESPTRHNTVADNASPLQPHAPSSQPASPRLPVIYSARKSRPGSRATSRTSSPHPPTTGRDAQLPQPSSRRGSFVRAIDPNSHRHADHDSFHPPAAVDVDVVHEHLAHLHQQLSSRRVSQHATPRVLHSDNDALPQSHTNMSGATTARSKHTSKSTKSSPRNDGAVDAVRSSADQAILSRNASYASQHTTPRYAGPQNTSYEANALYRSPSKHITPRSYHVAPLSTSTASSKVTSPFATHEDLQTVPIPKLPLVDAGLIEGSVQPTATITNRTDDEFPVESGQTSYQPSHRSVAHDHAASAAASAAPSGSPTQRQLPAVISPTTSPRTATIPSSVAATQRSHREQPTISPRAASLTSSAAPTQRSQREHEHPAGAQVALQHRVTLQKINERHPHSNRSQPTSPREFVEARLAKLTTADNDAATTSADAAVPATDSDDYTLRHHAQHTDSRPYDEHKESTAPTVAVSHRSDVDAVGSQAVSPTNADVSTGSMPVPAVKGKLNLLKNKQRSSVIKPAA